MMIKILMEKKMKKIKANVFYYQEIKRENIWFWYNLKIYNKNKIDNSNNFYYQNKNDTFNAIR